MCNFLQKSLNVLRVQGHAWKYSQRKRWFCRTYCDNYLALIEYAYDISSSHIFHAFWCINSEISL